MCGHARPLVGNKGENTYINVNAMNDTRVREVRTVSKERGVHLDFKASG